MLAKVLMQIIIIQEQKDKKINYIKMNKVLT